MTGESYAGHYVPQLAKHILYYNLNTQKHNHINLNGIVVNSARRFAEQFCLQKDMLITCLQVGNTVTDNYYDNLGTVEDWWSLAMFSEHTYKQLINTCDFWKQKESNECQSLYSYTMDQEFGNIDQYNIYVPPCNNNSDRTGSSYTRQAIRLPHHLKKAKDPAPVHQETVQYSSLD